MTVSFGPMLVFRSEKTMCTNTMIYGVHQPAELRSTMSTLCIGYHTCIYEAVQRTCNLSGPGEILLVLQIIQRTFSCDCFESCTFLEGRMCTENPDSEAASKSGFRIKVGSSYSPPFWGRNGIGSMVESSRNL